MLQEMQQFSPADSLGRILKIHNFKSLEEKGSQRQIIIVDLALDFSVMSSLVVC